MINDAITTGKVDENKSCNDSEQIIELDESIEVLSPGAILVEARQRLSLSQEYIANKLNLKISQIQSIENDIFDPLIPATFNRGYIMSYAKLVGVSVSDILTSYDSLNAAKAHRSEMLSFSKETTKQAEYSRVMWLSYFIIAVLIGLTVLWWLQENKTLSENSPELASSTALLEPDYTDSNIAATNTNTAEEQKKILDVNATSLENNTEESTLNPKNDLTNNQTEPLSKKASSDTSTELMPVQTETKIPVISTAVFTFYGDCWVNIYDATGERIAWGVKKSGYVMTINGKAPLSITVGKPELTSIVFNENPVDMSAFEVGNIAKFNLPISDL